MTLPGFSSATLKVRAADLRRRCPQLSRFAFTGVFLAVMIAANLAAIRLLPGGQTEAALKFGISLEALLEGEIWRLVTASLLTHDVPMFLRQVAFAALAIGLFEWRNGTRRAAATFWGIDILGTVLLFALVIGPYDLLMADPESAMRQVYDVGISGGAFGILGALTRDFSGRHWVIVTALGLTAIVTKLVLWPEPIADLLHLITFALGAMIPAARRKLTDS
ncbi:MAG: hypothetical protein VX974_03830 [Pseudomonadota bacterium]|nr:hypothetical protein [Pseudomonadota bacterium]